MDSELFPGRFDEVGFSPRQLSRHELWHLHPGPRKATARERALGALPWWRRALRFYFRQEG